MSPFVVSPVAGLGSDRLIKRPALAARLAEASRRQCLVIHAPAGYGKTSAAALAVAAWKMPVAWYGAQLWHGGRFVEHLVAQVRALRKDFGRLTLSLVRRAPQHPAESRGPAWSQHVGATFADELSHLDDPLVVVVDDCHLLDGEPSFSEFVAGAMRVLPANVRLVIAGRTPPDLPLAEWLMQERATLLDADDLKFDAQETAAVAKLRNVPLGPAKAAELCSACEGWPAGILLSLSAGTKRIPSRHGSRPALVAYLLDQTIAAMPPRLAAFLEKTSSFETLDAALLAEHAGLPDALERLRELERSGAMVSVIEHEASYRVHPMLREALLERVRARDGEAAVRALHAWAGKALESAGSSLRALYHYELGEADAGMLEVLRRDGPGLVASGHADLVWRAVERLQRRGVEAPAIFGYLRGSVLSLRGEPRALEEFHSGLAAAERGDDDGLTFALRFAVIDSLQDGGDPVPDELLAQLLEHGRRRGADNEADALLMAAWGQAARTNYAEAVKIAERALALAGPRASASRRARLVNLLAYALTCLGEFAKADAVLSEALRDLEASDDAASLCQFLILCARTALLWNDFQAAQDYAEQGAALAQKLNVTSVLSQAYLYVAYVRSHLGDAAGCRAAAERVLAYKPFTAYAAEKDRIGTSARQYMARSTFLEGDAAGALASARKLLDSRAVSELQQAVVHADAAAYAVVAGAVDAASVLDAAQRALVSAIPAHGGEAHRLHAAAAIVAAIRAALGFEEEESLVRIPGAAAYEPLRRAREEAALEKRFRAAARALVVPNSLRLETAATRFAQAMDELLAVSPSFQAIATLAVIARLAQQRPALASTLGRALRGRCSGRFAAPIPALAAFDALLGAGAPAAPRRGQQSEDARSAPLTKREREILSLLALGLTNKEIAQRLVLSVRTVDAHVEHVLAKLGVSSRTLAVAAAARLGILR